jgi:hypothetical protein
VSEPLQFSDLKLLPGTKLDLRSDQYSLLKGPSVYIGNLGKKGIIVSTPLNSGRPITCKTGVSVVVRLFVNHLNCACAFRSKVLHTSISPFPHLFLEVPEEMEIGEVRNSVRANVNLIASAKTNMVADAQSVVINNLSTDGARLECKMYLGDPGDEIKISAKVNVLDVEHIVKLKGIIRSTSDPQNKDFFGIQFVDLNDSQRLILYAYVMSEITG